MAVARTQAGSGPSIAIIGAGFGGIATAVRLKQAGIDSFVLFDKAPGPGGTWWHNRYPGAEVDVSSFLYSFSFMPYKWQRTHAPQAELQQYFEDVIDHFGLRSRCQFSTQVTDVVWDAQTQDYRLSFDGGERRFDVVVSAMGLFNEPRYPTWPGLEDFAGPRMHTARWDASVDLTGARVAVVGTGSSAVQLTPALAEFAGHVYLFQREPGWVLPKGERDLSAEEQEKYIRSPIARKRERYKEFRNFTRFLGLFVNGSKTQAKLRQAAIDYINSTVADPEVRKNVTPAYPFGCKRIILATTYYPALNRPNVTLIPFAVERIGETGPVAANGEEYAVDAIVMATGFRTTEFLPEVRMVGANGVEIHDFWRDDPQAVLGSTVPGYPNFFMLYGPNSNGGGSIVYQLERQAEMIARAIKRMRRTHAQAIETKAEFYKRYNTWLQSQIMKRMDASQPKYCNNYYFSSSGRNVTQWPLSAMRWQIMTFLVPRIAFEFRRRSEKGTSATVNSQSLLNVSVSAKEQSG